jgi:hypothetical protein
MVVTDETGLHAETCECSQCEIGNRPTELERAAARRALAARRAAEERAARKAVAAKVAGTSVAKPRIMAEAPRGWTPPTAREWEELQQLRETMFRRK